MEQAVFEAKYASVKEKLRISKNAYDFKTKDEAWSNIGTNSLDLAFTELSNLYLEANETQRDLIFAESGEEKYLYDLWYFIRRIAKIIKSQGDSKWLEVGLAASRIDGARTDFRDLIVSLVILRYSAEKHGIESKPYFDITIENSDEKLKPILINVRDHKESDIQFTIQNFGWQELIEENKSKYREHPSVTKNEKWQEEKKETRAGIRNVIIFFLILALLYLWSVIKNLIGN